MLENTCKAKYLAVAKPLTITLRGSMVFRHKYNILNLNIIISLN